MAKIPSNKTKPPRQGSRRTDPGRGIDFSSQISDRNFLTPTGFLFQCTRMPKISYFGNMINVPGMDLGVAVQPTYLNDIPRPGDKIQFNDLTLRFLIDENLENYLEVQQWMRGIGYPESLQQIYDFQHEGPITSNMAQEEGLNIYSDGTLQILNQLNRPVFYVKFENMFPYRLDDIQYDATTTTDQYLTATVSFKYTIYNIEPATCC